MARRSGRHLLQASCHHWACCKFKVARCRTAAAVDDEQCFHRGGRPMGGCDPGVIVLSAPSICCDGDGPWSQLSPCGAPRTPDATTHGRVGGAGMAARELAGSSSAVETTVEFAQLRPQI